MSVTVISAAINTATYKTETTQVKNTAAPEKEVKNQGAQGKGKAYGKVDAFEKSQPKQQIGYENINKKGLSTEQVNELKDQMTQGLKNMVKELIDGQIKAGKGQFTQFDFSSLKIDISKVDISMTSADISKIDNIMEDSIFGVDAMSKRIMDMAISLSGRDSSKAELLLGAVEKGFEQATAAWGDELPEVSQATLKEVRNRFNYWKENGSLEGYVYKGYDSASNATEEAAKVL